MQYMIAPRCGVCGTVNSNGQPRCPRCGSDLRVAAAQGSYQGARSAPGQAAPTQARPPAGPPQYGPPPYGPPHQGQPPYGPPQPGQSPYGPPRQGQPPYGPPQQGQPPYGPPQQGQPPYGPPQQGQPPYGPAPYGRPYPPGAPPSSAPYSPQGPYGQPVPGRPYAQASHRQVAAAHAHKSGAWPWLGAVSGVGMVMLFVTIFWFGFTNGGIGPQPHPCPQPCKGPPPGQPIPPGGGPPPPPVQPPPPSGPAMASVHTYTSSSQHYQVLYYDTPLMFTAWREILKSVGQDDKSIGWVVDLTNRTGADWIVPAQWPYGFTGQPAGGRSAKQVVDDYKSSKFPDAQPAFEIPNADLGHEPGYGAVYDVMVRTSTGGSARARLFLVASVKGDTAVIFMGLGSYYVEPKPGHPNPARSIFAYLFGGMPDEVVMPGDKPL